MHIFYNSMLCYGMRFKWLAMRFQCNFMKIVCYSMIHWNEVLNDMVCYAMRFEQKHLHTQKSSKLVEADKNPKLIIILNMNIDYF